MWEVYGQMYQYSQSNLSPYIFGKTSCWFHSRYLGITQLHDTSPLPLAGARREHVLDDHPNSWVVSLIMDFPASCSIWKRVTTLKRWSKHEENPLFPLSYLVDPHKLPEFLSKMVLTKENPHDRWTKQKKPSNINKKQRVSSPSLFLEVPRYLKIQRIFTPLHWPYGKNREFDWKNTWWWPHDFKNFSKHKYA